MIQGNPYIYGHNKGQTHCTSGMLSGESSSFQLNLSPLIPPRKTTAQQKHRLWCGCLMWGLACQQKGLVARELGEAGPARAAVCAGSDCVQDAALAASAPELLCVVLSTSSRGWRALGSRVLAGELRNKPWLWWRAVGGWFRFCCATRSAEEKKGDKKK